MRPLFTLLVLLAVPAFSAGVLHHSTRQKGPGFSDGAPMTFQGGSLGPLHRSTREKGPGAVAPATWLRNTADPRRPSHPPTREKGPSRQAAQQA